MFLYLIINIEGVGTVIGFFVGASEGVGNFYPDRFLGGCGFCHEQVGASGAGTGIGAQILSGGVTVDVVGDGV